ncbi:PAS domain S-box protein [Pedobacter frigidisoli]|uniref:histidine kinase n=1 Tax=Pedobacter frigidisoli TaxID=2530455 RepID=A0A4R0P5A0_9SPHI|nr:PAS domain-containing sensor histidine kinase [Pedobacter frigidisoli]TCD12041.1 PAS domain S-box protein [Pedobacter frigidisoli]
MDLEKLRFTSDQLLDVLALSENATAIYTGENTIIQAANDAMLRFWGKNRSVIGKPLREAVPELVNQPFLNILKRVWETAEIYTGKDELAEFFIDNEMKVSYYDFIYRPIFDANGNINSILHTATDVTDKVESNLRLQETEQKLQLAVDAANFGTWTIDTQTQTLIASDRLKVLFGFYPDEEITLTDVIEQINPEYRKSILESINKTMLEGGTSDLTYMVTGHYDGIKRWLRAVGSVSGNKGFTIFAGVMMDITERKLVEIEKQELTDSLGAVNEELTAANEELSAANEDIEESKKEMEKIFHMLEDSEVALRLAIEAADFGTWHINSVTREFITSVRLRELFGYRADEEITIEQALAQITEEYRSFVSQKLEKAIYGGGNYDVTYPVVGFHDNQMRWLRAIGNLKTDPSGQFSSFTGVVMDVSEFKKDEQRKNDFIGMVSHELKTPLTSIGAYVQLLQKTANSKGDNSGTLIMDKAINQVRKMNKMINGFLNVSRLESGKISVEKQPFDMAELLTEISADITPTITRHHIIFEPVEFTMVNADRDKIAQVIGNLISNAVKYSPAGSTINVACIQVGNEVKLSVTDHGIGIKPEDFEKVFQRYYRIESNMSGTVSGFGIGLYLCHEIIQRHGGKIWVDSEVGKGSVFSFMMQMWLN